MAAWGVRLRLLVFAAAAFVVGAWGCAVLWQSGYQSRIPALLVLPASWLLEIVVYSVSRGRGTGFSAAGAVFLGLVSRAAMATATTVIARGQEQFASTFVLFYAMAWVGVALQIAMAALLVWFIAGLQPTMAEIKQPPVPVSEDADERRRLLDELLQATDVGARVAEDEAGERGGAGGGAGPGGGVEGEAAGAAEEEVIEVVLEPEEAEEREDARASEMAPATQAAEAGADEETSELAAVSVEPGPAAPEGARIAREVVGWAVAEVVRHATGIEDVTVLEGSPGDLVIVCNLPSEVQDGGAASSCARGAGAAAVLAESGFLGSVSFAFGLFRAGGLVVTPARDGLVWLHTGAPATLGQLATLGRRLAIELESQWPDAAVLVEESDLPTVGGGGGAVEAVARWARAAGVEALSHRVDGTGTVVTLGSAGCDHRRAAAAAAGAWRSWSELGRTCGRGGLRRLVLACDSGAAAVANAQLPSGEQCLLVRMAPQTQCGLVAAEIERVVQACEGGDSA